VGWRGLWLLGVLLTLLTLFIGYLFAKYALSPIVKQNEELDRLLKDTLHELNIPVATIKANVSLLKRKIKEHKELRRLERIESAANQLLELYKEVDYGIKKRIDKAEKEVIDLEEFIKERIEFFSELLKERKIILELSPLKIKVSKHSFTKAFDNLLSNAIKYSTAGSLIQIIVKGDKLMIKDNGEGIEESELIKIFERFYRANEKKEGFGIGLSIVKSCCDEEGIEIRIDSKRGRGTTVALNLKRVKVDDRTS